MRPINLKSKKLFSKKVNDYAYPIVKMGTIEKRCFIGVEKGNLNFFGGLK